MLNQSRQFVAIEKIYAIDRGTVIDFDDLGFRTQLFYSLNEHVYIFVKCEPFQMYNLLINPVVQERLVINLLCLLLQPPAIFDEIKILYFIFQVAGHI